MSRLIDADALREQLVWCMEQAGRFDTYWDDVIERLDSIPTADAVPVVHGRWTEQHVDYASDCAIDEIQTLKCSVCGLYHTTPYMYYVTHYKYCPNCGAKMDLEGR